MNRRRALLALAAFGPLASRHAFAAEGKRVGVLSLASAGNFRGRREALLRGLREAGAAAGVTWDWRHGDGRPETVATLARELAALQPAVLVADGTPTAIALRQASESLPIVVANADDPVASRLARTLDAPGTNVTGIVGVAPDEMLRSVGWLARVVAKGATVALLANQSNATYRKIRARVHHASRQAGLTPVFVDANTAADLEPAFAELRREKAAGLLVMSDPLYYDERSRLVKLAAAWRKPVVFPHREFAEAGGALAYGPRMEDHFFRAAAHVRRILDGASPAEMAMEGPSPHELAIHRGAARAQGLRLPPELEREAKHRFG